MTGSDNGGYVASKVGNIPAQGSEEWVVQHRTCAWLAFSQNNAMRLHTWFQLFNAAHQFTKPRWPLLRRGQPSRLIMMLDNRNTDCLSGFARPAVQGCERKTTSKSDFQVRRGVYRQFIPPRNFEKP